MLPATGKFREINCPFFENNCCDRPYCHFKHKKERSKEREKLILKELVTKSVKQLLTKEMKLGEALLASEDKKSNVEESNEQIEPKIPDYQPTPITELSKQEEKVNNEENDNMEYPPKEKVRHIPVPYTPLQPDKYKRRGSLFSSLLQNDYISPPCTSTIEHSHLKSYYPTPINTVMDFESDYEPTSKLSCFEFKEYTPQPVETHDTNCLPSYNPTPKLNDSFHENQLSDILENIDFDSFEEEFEMIQGILDEENRNEENDLEKNVHEKREKKTKSSSHERSKKQSEKVKEKSDSCKRSKSSLDDHKKSSKSSSKRKSETKISSKTESKDSKSLSNKSDSKDNSKLERKDRCKSESKDNKSESNKLESKEGGKCKAESRDTKSESNKSENKDSSKSESKDKCKSESKNSKSESNKTENKDSNKSESRDRCKSESKNSKSDSNKSENKDSSKSESKDRCKSESKDKCKSESKSSKPESNKSENKDSSKSESKDRWKSESKDKCKSESKDRSKPESKDSSHNKKSHKPRERDKKYNHKSSSTLSSSNSDRKHDKEHKHKSSGKSKIKEINKHETNNQTKSCGVIKKDRKQKKSTEENVTMSDSDFEDDNDVMDTNTETAFENKSSISNSESEDDCMNECYEIFKSYSSTKHGIATTKIEVGTNTDLKIDDETCNLSKKRVAHPNAAKDATRKVKEKVKNPMPAMMMMMERYKVSSKIEPLPEEKLDESFPEPKKKRVSHLNTFGMSTALQYKTKRISAVANVQSLLEAKAKVQEFSKQSSNAVQNRESISKSVVAKILASRNSASDTGASKTIAHTVSKGGKRIAHTPDAPTKDWPSVLNPEKSKLPLNIRTKFYHLLVDACLKMYTVDTDAFERAQMEEWKCFNRCATIVTYRNCAMLSVNRLRKEATDPSQEIASKPTVWTCVKLFYENIKAYCMTKEQFDANGYPLDCGIVGQAIFKTYQKTKSLPPNQRQCVRCKKIYGIDRYGFPTVDETCIFHSLRKRTFRGESSYMCCQSNSEIGCTVSNNHVSETKTGSGPIDGYQQTLPPSGPDDIRSTQVFALDCEMCYTTKGLELTRLTIIDMNLTVIYDSFIKPLHPILDYNTQFSGITAKDLENCTTNIVQAQATILSICNSETILIGHSLESDLKAMKIIHGTVIDTSLLFPHRLGPPYKKKLSFLAQEFLHKIIQNDASGHDSAEDARTCMELVKWRLNEDLKLK